MRSTRSGTTRATRIGVALIVAAAVAAPLSPTNRTLARFSDTVSVGGNDLHTGIWARRYYLHNNPSPPTGNTTSQLLPAMDGSAPVATTLYNYDTNCSNNSPGRDLRRTSTGVNETRTCYAANWAAPVQAAPLAINGQAALVIWSATRNFATGVAGNLTSALIDYDPGAGTSTVVTIVGLTRANWQGGSGTWVIRTLTFPTVNYTIPTGHQLAVRIVATTAASRTMWVAYDTATYQSYVQLP